MLTFDVPLRKLETSFSFNRRTVVTRCISLTRFQVFAGRKTLERTGAYVKYSRRFSSARLYDRLKFLFKSPLKKKEKSRERERSSSRSFIALVMFDRALIHSAGLNMQRTCFRHSLALFPRSFTHPSPSAYRFSFTRINLPAISPSLARRIYVE